MNWKKKRLKSDYETQMKGSFPVQSVCASTWEVKQNRAGPDWKVDSTDLREGQPISNANTQKIGTACSNSSEVKKESGISMRE